LQILNYLPRGNGRLYIVGGMDMGINRSAIKLIVVFLMMVGLSSACGVSNTANSDLVELANLTPTMHTAFLLTPAAERMPDAIPVEGVGMYQIGGMGSGGTQNALTDIETAVSDQDEEGTLVEETRANNGNGLIDSQVVTVTPLPQLPVSGNHVVVAPNSAQSMPVITPPPPIVNVNPSLPAQKTPSITATPTPICGGNHFHNVGPAHKVERMPIEFEEFGSWMRSEHTYGAFLQTNLLQKSGSTAAWLCYFFNTPEDETAVFTQIRPVPGNPNTVRMWVYGNRSGHYLGVWILDKEFETWLVPLGPILHEGWELMEATFAGPDADIIFYISGPSNDRIDYPISFRAISLNDSPDETITHGSVVIDQVDFITK
jgi:hypothetical protein